MVRAWPPPSAGAYTLQRQARHMQDLKVLTYCSFWAIPGASGRAATGAFGLWNAPIQADIWTAQSARSYGLRCMTIGVRPKAKLTGLQAHMLAVDPDTGVYATILNDGLLNATVISVLV
jgi:hypothetical protein